MKGHENIIPPKKGEVRNPKGRTPGVPNTKTRMKRLFQLVVKQQNPITGQEENFTGAEMLDMALFGKALSGDVNAYKEIIDRVEGKVKNAPDDAIINVEQQQINIFLDGKKIDLSK